MPCPLVIWRQIHSCVSVVTQILHCSLYSRGRILLGYVWIFCRFWEWLWTTKFVQNVAERIAVERCSGIACMNPSPFKTETSKTLSFSSVCVDVVYRTSSKGFAGMRSKCLIWKVSFIRQFAMFFCKTVCWLGVRRVQRSQCFVWTGGNVSPMHALCLFSFYLVYSAAEQSFTSIAHL